MFKPSLRHYLYFLSGIIYIFAQLKPICYLQPLKLITVIAPWFLIVLIIEIIIIYQRSYAILSHLHQGDIHKFLEETDKEITKAPNKTWRAFYQLNKTAGLCYLGRFDESLELLDTINDAKLPKMHQHLYVNNRLANLLGAERIEEAKQLVENHPNMFQRNKHNRKFYAALQANLGVYKYFENDLTSARNLLIDSIKSQAFPLSLAVRHYYLGLISQKEQKTEEAESHFQKAKKLGQGSYIIDRLS